MVEVSIFMITYNHEKYIEQAIESIVRQKTNFTFELVIGEDCSTDATRRTCEAFQQKYPQLIKLLPSDANYGPMGNTIRTLDACTGRYIAMCEGDDYWNDINKLQRQFDFLEANTDYSMCFSDVEIINEIETNRITYPVFVKDTYLAEDLILSPMSLIPTATLFYRNILPKPLPALFGEAMAGDMVIQLLIADKGKVKFMNEKLAVYRNHAGGLSKTDEMVAMWANRLMQTYQSLNEYFDFRYDAIFKKRFLEMTKVQLIHGAAYKGGLARLKHYFKFMPMYLKYSSGIDIKEILYYHLILFAPFFLKLKKTA